MSPNLYRRIVVKIGSNVITLNNGLPDMTQMAKIVKQLVVLKKQKAVDVVLVSSGAVACGRSMVRIADKSDPVAERQQLAAVGQVKLIHTYAELFAQDGFNCAQVLVTKEDFRDRKHYLNMKSCVSNLLNNQIIPVVNENDVIAVTELMFTDNDELSGLIASMTGAEALIILTSVDGLYTGHPNQPDSELISVVEEKKMDFSFITPEKSSYGRGGMITKARMAYNVARLGVNVHVANGRTDDILLRIMKGEAIGTKFVAHKKISTYKRWIADSEGYAKAVVYINAGAEAALAGAHGARSLLPVGITRLQGHFEKGDMIKIMNEAGIVLGIGQARYNSLKAVERMGLKNQPPLVHYDYLFLNN